MAQQTAVDWFTEKLNEFNGADNPWFDIPLSLLEQAKAMEKEQIKKAYYTDAVSRPIGVLTSLSPVLKTFENYYNETYTNGL